MLVNTISEMGRIVRRFVELHGATPIAVAKARPGGWDEFCPLFEISCKGQSLVPDSTVGVLLV